MSIRTIIVILLSVVCGVASAVGVNQIRDRQVAEAVQQQAPAMETVKVLVARVDIPAIGTVLQKEMLSERDWPEEYVPRGAITDPELLVGKTVHAPLVRGEIILDAKVGIGKGMAGLIEEGYRAYTIATPSASSSVAGFVLPGDRVDIYMLRESSQGYTGGTVTSILLQNVKVIAARDIINPPSENNVKGLRHVTLSVTPEEVAVLQMAQTRGTLALALRGGDDNNPANIGAVYWRDVAMDTGEFELESRSKLAAFMDTVVGFLQKKSAEVAEQESKPGQLGPNQQILALRGSNASVINFQSYDQK